MNLVTTAAAPANAAATNAKHNNQKQQVTNMIINEVSDNLLEYQHLSKVPNAKIWQRVLENDLGRLAQGVRLIMPKGTNTIFIHPRTIPNERKVA